MASLLPSNATAAERALAEAVARVDQVPVPIREVWSPDNCPSALLPWLAWAFSVDEWDEGWTDEQKRAAIRASVFVHSHKGTIGALTAALGALGYPISVIEWFKDSPVATPYTFKVDVEVTDRPIGEDLLAVMLRIIWKTKNVRSHLTKLRVVLASRGTLWWAATLGTGGTICLYPEMVKEVQSEGAIYFGIGQLFTSTITVQPG